MWGWGEMMDEIPPLYKEQQAIVTTKRKWAEETKNERERDLTGNNNIKVLLGVTLPTC